MTVIDLKEEVAKWFEMEGGGRVQLRTLSVQEFRDIQKKTVKVKDIYRKVEGTPARFEKTEIDQDLQNELYWDAAIVGWENLMDRTGEPIPCTRENKVLLMTKSKTFLEFVVDSLRQLSEDEADQKEAEEKN